MGLRRSEGERRKGTPREGAVLCGAPAGVMGDGVPWDGGSQGLAGVSALRLRQVGEVILTGNLPVA